MMRTEALHMPAVARAPLAGSGEAAIPYRVPVYIACTALALATNYLLGKDVAWDTLNYHLCLGYSALNDRFGQDYFAAGSLGYLNPYAYAPILRNGTCRSAGARDLFDIRDCTQHHSLADLRTRRGRFAPRKTTTALASSPAFLLSCVRS